jgi:hypothetical protein
MKDLTESEQWLIEQVRSNALLTKLENDPALEEVRRFAKSYWPFMEPYHSPLNAAFSFEIGHLERLRHHKLWMLRDGIIPLAWFFESVTREMTPSTQLLVHESLGTLVPKSWKKNVKYYEIYSEPVYHAGFPPKNLLLTGPINGGMTSLEELDAILDGVLECLGRAKPERVLIYCPIRQSEWSSAEEESFEFQFYHRIFSRFGAKAKFVNWQSTENSTFPDTAVVDLSAGWIYKDSSVLHHLLRRGAGLLGARENVQKPANRIPLSKNHGIRVSAEPAATGWELPRDTQKLLGFYSTLHRKMNEPRSHLPWPKWFQGFMRAGGQHSHDRGK